MTTDLSAWWRLACDACEILGPVIAESEGAAAELHDDPATASLVLTAPEGELLRDGIGDLWPVWSDFAVAHEGHDVVVVPLDNTGRFQPRPAWRGRMLHGPWPYEVDRRPSARPVLVSCSDTPGESCGRTHQVYPAAPGPGRMAQKVVCPTCGSHETQWYWSERYGAFIHCRGCGIPSGPGAENHYARERLRLSTEAPGESPEVATLVDGAIAVPGSSIHGR